MDQFQWGKEFFVKLSRPSCLGSTNIIYGTGRFSCWWVNAFQSSLLFASLRHRQKRWRTFNHSMFYTRNPMADMFLWHSLELGIITWKIWVLSTTASRFFFCDSFVFAHEMIVLNGNLWKSTEFFRFHYRSGVFGSFSLVKLWICPFKGISNQNHTENWKKKFEIRHKHTCCIIVRWSIQL